MPAFILVLKRDRDSNKRLLVACQNMCVLTNGADRKVLQGWAALLALLLMPARPKSNKFHSNKSLAMPT